MTERYTLNDVIKSSLSNFLTEEHGSMTRHLRKDDVLVSILDFDIKISEEYDFTKVQQLPDYEYLYGRFYTILSEIPIKEKKRTDTAIWRTATEFRNIWITMNIYPISYTSVQKRFSKLLKDFHLLLTRGESQKSKPWWKKKAQDIVDSMKNGVDIISNDSSIQKALEKKYGVKMTESEIEFHKDNCIIVTDKADPFFGKCRRNMWSGDVDKNWLAAAKKKRERLRKEDERLNRRKEKEEIDRKVENEPEPVEENQICSEDHISDDDVRYTITTPRCSTPETFPEIPARYSIKELNLDIIEVIAHLECYFEIPANRSRQVVAYVLNRLCGQNLVVPTEDEEKEEDRELKEEQNGQKCSN